MTVGRPAPALDTAARARRALAGVALALAFHALVLGMIVYRLTGKPPAPLAEAAEMSAVAISLAHGAAPLSTPQADEAKAASTPSQLPVTDALAAPPRPPDSTSAMPRSTDAEPQALSPQKAADAPDLAREPTPLHRPAAGLPSAGAAPPMAGAPDCRLAPAIQRVLQENPDVLGAITRLPRQARSVANAVVLWQGGWSSDQPMPVIQSALQATIRQVAAACRDQPMRGPQFMTVSEGGGTTVLVVGSGDWTWGQLLR